MISDASLGNWHVLDGHSCAGDDGDGFSVGKEKLAISHALLHVRRSSCALGLTRKNDAPAAHLMVRSTGLPLIGETSLSVARRCIVRTAPLSATFVLRTVSRSVVCSVADKTAS